MISRRVPKRRELQLAGYRARPRPFATGCRFPCACCRPPVADLRYLVEFFSEDWKRRGHCSCRPARRAMLTRVMQRRRPSGSHTLFKGEFAMAKRSSSSGGRSSGGKRSSGRSGGSSSGGRSSGRSGSSSGSRPGSSSSRSKGRSGTSSSGGGSRRGSSGGRSRSMAGSNR
jgi:hypothetical protein